MKKIYTILLSALLFTSCLNDFLDVQPVSDISNDTFWKTESDARAALNSIYRDFQLAYNSNESYLHLFELRSDNFFGLLAASSMPSINTNTNKISSNYAASSWNRWYKAISTANYALHFLPNMQELTETKREKLLAEAYFLRAFSYFNLARIWGNVPKITKPTLSIGEVEKPTQSAQTEILKLVGEDLDEAVKRVDDAMADLFFFNAGALYALYTDYAMWMHDYEKAEFYSQKVINLKRYKLVDGTDFAKVCSTGTTTENIWTMKWSYDSNGGNLFIHHMCGGIILFPTQGIKDLWDTQEYAEDCRRAQTLDESIVYPANHLSNSNAAWSIWKWQPGERVIRNNEKYYPFYRYADVLLLRAEALNQLDRPEEALEHLNMVRARAGVEEKELTDFTTGDRQKAIEDAILQERQLEFIGEGRRWFDLVRTGRAMSVMNDYFENYIEFYSSNECPRFVDEWQLYWPVYYNDLLENENLVQNGNY